MRAFVFVTLFAVALAEPQLYDATHYTAGFKAYTNGAVVPEDTLSVKAAKAQHHTAKANAYATKGYMPYFGQQYAAPMMPQPVQYAAPMMQKAVQYAAPIMQKAVPYAAPMKMQSMAPSMAGMPYMHQQMTYAHNGIYSPMTSAYSRLLKREAEAEPEADSQYYSSYYGSGLPWGRNIYNPYSFSPYTSGIYSPLTTAYTGFVKREAEAEPEADSQFYSNYYGTGLPWGRSIYGTYNPYTTGYYSPLTTPYSRMFKREAEAKAEPEADSQYYGSNYYGTGRPWGNSYYGTPYSTWNRFGYTGWY